MNRRKFLQVSAAGLALSALGNYAAEVTDQKKRVGLIGCGWYGKVDLLRLIQVAPVEVVSLCDVDKRMLAEAADIVAGRQLSNTFFFFMYVLRSVFTYCSSKRQGFRSSPQRTPARRPCPTPRQSPDRACTQLDHQNWSACREQRACGGSRRSRRLVSRSLVSQRWAGQSCQPMAHHSGLPHVEVPDAWLPWLMVKRGHRANGPQASEGEAQPWSILLDWTSRSRTRASAL